MVLNRSLNIAASKNGLRHGQLADFSPLGFGLMFGTMLAVENRLPVALAIVVDAIKAHDRASESPEFEIGTAMRAP